MRGPLIAVGLTAYLVTYLVEPSAVILLGIVLAALVNRWWIVLLGLTWITLPLVDSGEVGGPDDAGEWNPYPVVALIVVPLACAAFASGVAVRRLAGLAVRRRRPVR